MSVRITIVLAGSLLAGCLAGTGSYDLYDSPRQPRAGRMPPAPGASARPVTLRRRHEEGDRFRHSSTAWFAAEGVNTGIRAHVITDGTIARTERGFVEREEVVESRADGTSTALNPGPVAHTIVGARLTTRVDPFNRPEGEPELDRHHGADGNLAEVMRVAFGRLRVTFPEGEVRPGDTWQGPEVFLDTVGSGGWVRLRMRPTFVLRGVDGAYAEIDWGGSLESEPFCQLGPCVIGRGHIEGHSRVAVADGHVGRTQLRIPVDILGEDAPDGAPPLLRFVARYVSTVRRL